MAFDPLPVMLVSSTTSEPYGSGAFKTLLPAQDSAG